ncbi:MAG: hypothetical protein V7721_03240 [Porticoccaceae bacterium]
MKKPMRTLISAAVVLMFISAPTFAEVVKVPVGSQAADKRTIATPHRGLSKNQVKSQYGEPEAVHGPTGQPPITAWDYDHYVVYFEYDKVLHSVLKR